jgi:putative DNA methylase
MPDQVKTRKKLIEVALPLEAINIASAREKSIRHGHPSTLHLWWARRPLAAARAVIFSQMVDDPSEYVEVLLADAKAKRKAESVVKARLKVWEEAKATAEKAERAGIESQGPTPGPEPTLREVIAELERERLFEIIRKLVLWENTTNEEVLQAARDEIWQSWRRTCAENADHPRAKELFDRHKLPAFHDPFAGGGALPLEAQRLGLEAYASDLNPVAVLINKAMIEIPPKFAGRPPVNPDSIRGGAHGAREWRGAQGLAEDVRYYGQWMRDEAEKRIGHLYPKISVTPEMAESRPDLKPYVGRSLTVIAWLWARTVKSPNPAFREVAVPLVSTFMLSTKPGKEAYVQPVVEDGGYRFTVRVGKPKDMEAAKNGTKLSRGAHFQCVMSGTPMAGDYIKAEGIARRMGVRLMAIVAEGDRGRVYLPAAADHEAPATKAIPTWKPESELPDDRRNFWTVQYGLTTYGDLFTSRQLVSLETFCDLIQEARESVRRDAVDAVQPDDGAGLHEGGIGSIAYADAVAVYLAFAIDKVADRGSSLGRWDPTPTQSGIINTFSRQALPMTWDFAEANPLGAASGNYRSAIDLVAKALLCSSSVQRGSGTQQDAATQTLSIEKVISTDPPYYDNIGYADLSDFFYVWLRRSLRSVFPDLFATVAVPKKEELVATPYRHGSKEKAEAFFLHGMTGAMHRLALQAHPGFPVTIYYAFKQSESDASDGTTNTGWDTFLGAVIEAGFAITGTWPMRTELSNRMIGSGTNALASSIVLVCRRRAVDAPSATRREFLNTLKTELPLALAHLQRGNIAPVDLAQAAIGPGMAVYTRFAQVLDAEANPLSVRQALALINEVLDETLAQQEGDFDPDTRWALTWFDENGFVDGDYGRAEQLSKSKNTSVVGMKDAGIIHSGKGLVRLLKPEELAADWDPTTDKRLTTWEIIHQLIRTLESGGESSAAQLVSRLGVKAETARELAYRLYTISERKKRAAEALSYNALVQSWPEITRLANETRPPEETQTGLFGSR